MIKILMIPAISCAALYLYAYVPRRLKCLQKLTSFASLKISSDLFSGAVVAVDVASKNVFLVDTLS